MHLHSGALLELWNDFDYMLLKQLVALFSARVYWIKQQLPKPQRWGHFTVSADNAGGWVGWGVARGSFVVKCCVLLKSKLCPSHTWMVKKGKCRRFWFYWETVHHKWWWEETSNPTVCTQMLATAIEKIIHSNVNKRSQQCQKRWKEKSLSFKSNERLK